MSDRAARARELRKRSTEAEQILWDLLRNRKLFDLKWRRQEPIGPYFADFACRTARLVVELDGSHHGEPDNAQYDEERTAFMEAKGWRVLRFSNREVAQDIDPVLEGIIEACNPHPSPSPTLGEGP